MKNAFLLSALIFTAVISPATATDPAPPQHWYLVEIATSKDSIHFVGSSPLDGNALAQQMKSGETIVLENPRDHYTDPKDGTLTWRPGDALRVIVMTRNIVFITEFPGDPAKK